MRCKCDAISYRAGDTPVQLLAMPKSRALPTTKRWPQLWVGPVVSRSGYAGDRRVLLIKGVLERCAASMEIEDAKQLRKASTHWFRHTRMARTLSTAGQGARAFRFRWCRTTSGMPRSGRRLGT